MLKKNSKRNAKSHPYIVCSDVKARGCYPQNTNYDKFENHILYVIKKIAKIYADKEIFYSIYEKYQNKTLDIRQGYLNKIEQIDKDKNVYIYFNFSKLNSINAYNQDEFIKIEEIINQENKKK